MPPSVPLDQDFRTRLTKEVADWLWENTGLTTDHSHEAARRIVPLVLTRVAAHAACSTLTPAEMETVAAEHKASRR